MNQRIPLYLFSSLVLQIGGILGLLSSQPVSAADQPEIATSTADSSTQATGDLHTLAQTSRDDHRPITVEQINSLRQQVHHRAHLLDQALASQGKLFRQQWKDYLQWNLLEQQLSPATKIERQNLIHLGRILKRFRSNHPGLERQEFTQTAKAIEQLRVAVRWALERNPRKYYQRQMMALSQQLKRHQTESTSETSWKIGRLLGLFGPLGQSAPLVSALQDSLLQPNVLVEVSESFIQQVGQRPVHNTQPVRDFILGTSIRGTAHTTGTIQIHMLPSPDDVQLEVQLTGFIRSLTQGHQKPVRIHSTGNTNFSATKRVTLNAGSFQASSAVVHANVQSEIQSIHKTGGPLGHRLIEKIAWKKACQSKGCAEQIASRHAEDKIASNFDEQLAEALTKAQQNYHQKILDPLVRRNLQPRHLMMNSQPDRIQIETTFASPHQLASAGSSPPLSSSRDLAMRIHQSAVTNYLALVLAGATIQQDNEDQPPKLTGNLPPWMSKVSLDERFQKKSTNPATDSEAIEESNDQIRTTESIFQPWSITLNAEQPVNVQFDNQQLILRLRASLLTSDEREYKNWDFIIRYDVESQGNAVILRRSGKIEVFPTGFDPQWDKRMSSAKSGFRSTLAKNMNARADRGESFPDEIPIPSIQLPPETGIQGELVLTQLDCNNHWLTLSWALP